MKNINFVLQTKTWYFKLQIYGNLVVYFKLYSNGKVKIKFKTANFRKKEMDLSVNLQFKIKSTFKPAFVDQTFSIVL